MKLFKTITVSCFLLLILYSDLMKAAEGNTGDNFLVANNDVSDVNSLQRGAEIGRAHV